MKVSKKILALLLCAALSMALLTACDQNSASINSGSVNANGYIVVANSPDEVIANESLGNLAAVTNLTFDCNTCTYSFTGVENADYYYIRVFAVVDGAESNSAEFQSDKIDATSGNTYNGTLDGKSLLAGNYNIYVVASGAGYSSSEAKTSGQSNKMASASVTANWATGTEEDPTVSATITITPGDSIVKTFTLVITDAEGKEVYRNDAATSEPITINAADLGVDALTVEDVYNVSVAVNEVEGYAAPEAPTTTTITEKRGWGPGGMGGPGGPPPM